MVVPPGWLMLVKNPNDVTVVKKLFLSTSIKGRNSMQAIYDVHPKSMSRFPDVNDKRFKKPITNHQKL